MNTKTNQTYIISARYYYYSGTCHAPADGVMTDEHGDRARFSCKQDALNWLFGPWDIDYTCRGHAEEGEHYSQMHGGRYQSVGTYHLSHGEYSRPDYRITKDRLSETFQPKLELKIGTQQSARARAGKSAGMRKRIIPHSEQSSFPSPPA